MSDPNTCEHDFVCTMCLQSRPDFPTTRAKYEAENAALREKLAVAERKLAMYEAADQVSFGENICVEGCTVWDYSSGSKERNGGRNFTVYPSHDAAVAKAFELSGGKLEVECE